MDLGSQTGGTGETLFIRVSGAHYPAFWAVSAHSELWTGGKSQQ